MDKYMLLQIYSETVEIVKTLNTDVLHGEAVKSKSGVAMD
jgi:hypothetical protein